MCARWDLVCDKWSHVCLSHVWNETIPPYEFFGFYFHWIIKCTSNMKSEIFVFCMQRDAIAFYATNLHVARARCLNSNGNDWNGRDIEQKEKESRRNKTAKTHARKMDGTNEKRREWFIAFVVRSVKEATRTTNELNQTNRTEPKSNIIPFTEQVANSLTDNNNQWWLLMI